MKPSPLPPDTVFVFVGDGLGIPGLPHRITQTQADALGLSSVLSEAIRNGIYAFIEPKSASIIPPQEK